MKNKYPQWLNDAVIYNIFPASFYDSNGDGIGDLAGIIQKLNYIQSLGVNLIWINPVFDSPFQDGGYDVRDYYKIAPRYGKNSDISKLCKEAKKRGMRIMLDLVPGHTSIEHPWFKSSASAEKTEYDNRYVWTDYIFRNAPGIFLGGDTGRSGKYLINFFSFQPALNYGYLNPKEPWQLPISHPDCVATRNELKKIMDFWLKKGVSGFRVDIANSLVKDDVNCKGLKIIYSDLRQWLDCNWPDAALLAEWSMPTDAVRCGFHMDFVLHSTPEFTQLFRMEQKANVDQNSEGGISFFRKVSGGSCKPFLDYFQKQWKSVNHKGLISFPTGNHDLPRIAFERTPAELKAAYGFIFTLPVAPALYYGDEIGMRYLPHSPNREGAYHRAGSRTPMQWDDSKNDGFSSAVARKIYLPQDENKNRPTVAKQEDDRNSLLNFTRRLIALRKKYPELGPCGDFTVLYAGTDSKAVIYCRSGKNRTLIIALNPGGQDVTAFVHLNGGLSCLLSSGTITAVPNDGGLEFYFSGISFAAFELIKEIKNEHEKRKK